MSFGGHLPNHGLLRHIGCVNEHHNPRQDEELNVTVNVLVHFPGLAELVGLVTPFFTRIIDRLEELKVMSQTNQDQVLAILADINSNLDALSTDATEISADVDTLLAGAPAGSTITPEMIASLTSVRDRVASLKTNLDAVNAKVPPAAPPVSPSP